MILFIKSKKFLQQISKKRLIKLIRGEIMCDKEMYQKLKMIAKKKLALLSKIHTRDGKLEYRKYTAIVNYCLNALKFEYREIITKSYLNPDYKYWWVDSYCKSCYYRKRIKAVNSFVRLYELIYENFRHFSNNIFRNCR